MQAKTLVAALALGAAASHAILATSAHAGLLIKPSGVFLTEPEIPAFIRDEDGQARFGGPATGYRLFGREGYSPVPADPGQPFNGRLGYGRDGRKAEPALHGRIVRKLFGFGD